MSSIEYIVTGDIDRLDRYTTRLFDNGVEKLGEALVMLAENSMTYAKAYTVPVLTGHLRSTGWVDPQPRIYGTSVEARMGFDADYSADQERLGRPVGANRARPLAGRRYMERAIVATMATANEQISRYFKLRPT